MDALATIRANIIKSQESVKTQLDAHVVAVAEEKKAELRAGLNSDGGEIRPEYSGGWWGYKQSLSTYHAPYLTPDLYHTGKFHKSIQAYRRGYGYTYKLVNPPSYAKDLLKRYLEPIGITEIGEKKLDIKLSSKIAKDLKNIW